MNSLLCNTLYTFLLSFSFFLLPFVLDFTSSYISRGKFYLHLDDFVLNHSSDLNMEAGTFHMPLVVVSASAVILWIRVSLGVFSALTCSITVIQDVSLFLHPSSLKTEGDYSKCSIFNWLFFFFFFFCKCWHWKIRVGLEPCWLCGNILSPGLAINFKNYPHHHQKIQIHFIF